MLKESETDTKSVTECFADDTMVYATGSTIKEAIEKLNQALNRTVGWCERNMLQLNTKKCCTMILTSKKRVKTLEKNQQQIFIGQEPLQQLKVVRYLGIQLDRNLTWEHQYSDVKKKMNNGIRMITRVKDGLPLKERLSLYHAFVEPALDYCAPVWSAASESLHRKIEVTQRNALRVIGGYRPRESVNQKFEEWKIETASQRWKRMDATWLFRIININSERNDIPEYMKKLVSFHENSYLLRGGREKRVDANCKTVCGERMLAWRFRSLFSCLPAEIWKAESLLVFRLKFLLL
jgi:hypothetical protein